MYVQINKPGKSLKTALSILTELAQNPSIKVKEAIINREKNNTVLREVFAAAYDPTISYYIKKIPAYKAAGKGDLYTAIKDLSALAQRKVTGQAGIDFLKKTLEALSEDDATVVVRIIDRDLKCGTSDSIASRTWKGLVPEFPYMRCSLLKGVKKIDKWDWKGGIYSQLKGDGMFCNTDLVDGGAVMSSRSGKVFPGAPFADMLNDAVSAFPQDHRIIGEMLVERNGAILPRQIGNGILNSVAQGDTFEKGDRPVLMVWDIIPSQFAVPSGRYSVPYKQRFEALKKYLAKPKKSVILIPTRMVHSMAEAYAHYFELVKEGLEGSIIKNPAGDWFDGTSKDQVKLKVECDVDLKITGFNPGNGKNAHLFGSIAVETSDGKLKVSVPGFSDKDRLAIHKNRDALVGTIMTVTFNSIMPPSGNNKFYSLFLPRCCELRTDKMKADSLVRVQEQFDAIIQVK